MQNDTCDGYANDHEHANSIQDEAYNDWNSDGNDRHLNVGNNGE